MRVNAMIKALAMANSPLLPNTTAVGTGLGMFVALKAMSRTSGKVVAQSFIAAIAPKPVPMVVVLGSNEFAIAKAFVMVARLPRLGKPSKTYAQFEAMVRSVGLEP